ncbi:MAG: serine/threonine-protein kinase [Myxococcaceae bacterium]|nr:serine/threonine-protein kinase [Myxococcaceae bacterium]
MSTHPSDPRLADVMSTLGSFAETVVRRPRSTVEPPRDAKTGRRALEVLRGLTHDPRALVEESVLGQGAMGVVTRARQVALDRAVAVKTLKKNRSPDDVEALLSEAWLAGSLEHPGILPIYALALGTDGQPQLVMKHIEGITWAHLLANDDERATFAPGRTRLESHLRVAMQVCNAVHFANARGVVHRDLKPENVMLGRFGEVYLVDWGIATNEGPTSQFAGTPAYMAPEMLGGEGATLSPRTDVYLLGSVLFEVATGQPPHLKGSIKEMVASVLASAPTLPEDVPDELGALIRSCMAQRPEARPGSALEVRLALEAFLEHQGSRELAAQSAERAKEFEAALLGPNVNTTQVARLFSECRFGFQQALRSWAGNVVASEGLARVIERMVRVELGRGAVSAARALLVDLPQPPPALVADVERAEAAEAEKAKELERLQRMAESLDPLTGFQRRFFVGLSLGVLWVIAPGLRFLMGPRVLIANDVLAAIPIAALSVVVIIIVSRRTRPEHRTPLNQQIARLLLFGMSFQIVAALVLLVVLDVQVGDKGSALLLGYWGLLAGVIASTVLPPVWPAVIGYFVFATLAWRWPASRDLFGSLGNLMLFVNLAWLFRRQRREFAGRQTQGPGLTR